MNWSGEFCSNVPTLCLGSMAAGVRTQPLAWIWTKRLPTDRTTLRLVSLLIWLWFYHPLAFVRYRTKIQMWRLFLVRSSIPSNRWLDDIFWICQQPSVIAVQFCWSAIPKQILVLNNYHSATSTKPKPWRKESHTKSSVSPMCGCARNSQFVPFQHAIVEVFRGNSFPLWSGVPIV